VTGFRSLPIDGMMAEKEDTLLTVCEAAKAARVSAPTMYRLVERGQVPAIRVGEGSGPIRIPADEFRAWLYGPPEGAA
jgi:excisionase family DNA binding protein